MLPRALILGVATVVALSAAAVVLAEEKTEYVGVAQTEPSDEWISSVEGDRVEIWAFGDADPPRSRDVARMISRANPDLVLYLGDVYPRGTRDDFRRWARSLGWIVDIMAPTPGNHEWPNARRGYSPFWADATGTSPPSHYAFNAAGWEILSANSEAADWEGEVAWLRDRVASGGNCRIAFWHRPRYTAGHHEGGNRHAEEFWEAVEGSARLILNGHDHNLQRMRERDGIVQLISGAGGRRLYNVNERDRRLAFSNDRRYGALHLVLTPGEVRWRFVSASGRRLDSGTRQCQP